MHDRSAVTTFLFTDIEGSTRLWEQEPERMSVALAGHDALARAVVERHHGTVVKSTGDGMHAVFDDPVDAVSATIELQRAIADLSSTGAANNTSRRSSEAAETYPRGLREVRRGACAA